MYLCTKWSWFRRSKYCIKFYEKADANAGGLDELMDEYVLMASLDNPHIAKTYEVFQDKSFYYLVNEPYFGGDLTKLGKNASQQGVRMGENWWRQIFRQCMDGLCYLHGNGVMHCDIKEPNIMISKSESYEAPQVVLIDFGLASVHEQSPGRLRHTRVHPPRDLEARERIVNLCDVWPLMPSL
ncbi:CPK1 [Symbiodinium sp. CCMP2592]|nr:CPK1 [Symbiodinium sp. CCMP2592]